jgi:hypothetical protein
LNPITPVIAAEQAFELTDLDAGSASRKFCRDAVVPGQ